MSKGEKFQNLLHSPSGSTEVKKEIIKPYNSFAEEFVHTPKKKATFELDVDLHKWLKMHSVATGRDMVDIVVEQLRRYRREIEGD